MNTARLLLLAQFLDDLDPTRFNFTKWVGGDWKGKPDLSCGTNACAIGWASTMPEFRSLGLRLDKYGFFPYLVNKYRHRIASSDRYEVIAQHLFGLTTPQFMHLFTPHYSYHWGNYSSYGASARISPQGLAEHIRKFVEANQ